MISRLIAKRNHLFLRYLFTTQAQEVTSELVSLKIDGKQVQVPKNTMLVEAIKKAGSSVPTMCYHPDLKYSGGICRICLVESAKSPGYPIISCKTPVSEGMDILTQGSKIKEYRQSNLAMMLSEHPKACLSCTANTKCKGQDLSNEMNIGQCGINQVTPTKTDRGKDKTTPIWRDNNKCINCDICVQTCKMQGLTALGSYNTGEHWVGTMGKLDVSECIHCGQCINRCPVGAIEEASEIQPVLKAMNDPTKKVVFQMAPSIRVALAEEFGCKPGERILKNEIVTALKKYGPNVTVLDTDFSADLTIIEEGHELIERLYRTVTGKKLLGGDHMPIKLPMFTSCCPGWVTFLEKNYPEMLDNLSTCKSPQGMLGGLIKGYWAKEVAKVDPKDIVSVSIMPCSAKKHEKDRSQLKADNKENDVDYVLTTRELAKMLRQSNIDPTKLEKTPFDPVLSDSTGAAVIFGVTGGVMEAALRTAYEVVTGRPVPFKNLNIVPVRGMEGIREAGIKLENVLDKYKAFEGFTIKIAVVHGPNNARKIIETIKQAQKAGLPAPWHFIEVMACPGGCIGGGGQPKPTNLEIRKARTELTFKEDMDLPLRKSHDNPEVKALYEKYLKEPLGHHSHHYLHTTYSPNVTRDMVTYNVDEASGLDSILARYPKHPQYLLPIVIEENDKKGYISDPSLVKIANHVQLYPPHVESILSHYHFFPRKYTSDAHIYLCRCHNCMMKGQHKVFKAIKDRYGVKDLHGSVSKDGRFTFHTMNWLGYCVNEGPAMMIKRTGGDYVETLAGLSENNIESSLNSLKGNIFKWAKNKIVERNLKAKGKAYSMLETHVPVKDAIKKAVKMGPKQVIKEVTEAKLLGRGGAGFMTGRKWESAYKADTKEKYVVCNADEGLPSTFKDWYLLKNENKRKEVLAGMGICANTIGARKCYMYLRYEYRNLVPEIEADIKKLQSECPELAMLNYEVRLGGGPYVAGEENAQFESIQGFAPIPRKDRPFTVFPTIEGLFAKPTVINNVETFACVPHIVQQGAARFQTDGLPKLLSVSGDVENPLIIESLLNGYSLNDLIKEVNAKDVIAAEIGGVTEPLIFNDKFNMPFGFGKNVVNAAGSVVLFDSACDIGEIYSNKLHFMADESCKQCVPCRDGTALLHKAFDELRTTGKSKYNERTLKTIAESAKMSSICAHGKALDPLFNTAFDYLKSKKPL